MKRIHHTMAVRATKAFPLKKGIAILIGAFMVLGCTSSETPIIKKAQSINNHPLEEPLDQLLKETARELPGISLLVSSPGRGFYLGSAGSLEWNQKSRIGSVSKVFAAVLAMTFFERGLLDLEAPATKYLPENVVSLNSCLRGVTVRMLMDHSSGIPSYTSTVSFGLRMLFKPRNLGTNLEFINMAADKKPLFSPGTSYQYSNTNYLLLELILEQVGGAPVKVLLDQLIFKPLEMEDSYYDPPSLTKIAYAEGYTALLPLLPPLRTTDYKMGSWIDGGIVSTLEDLFKFASALQSGELLSFQSLGMMTDWRSLPDDGLGLTGYGLGLRRWETPWGNGIGHTGGSWGYLSELFYFPDHNTTVIAFANGSLGRYNEVFDYRFHNLLPELLFAEGY